MSIEIANFTDHPPTNENIKQMVALTAEDLSRGGLAQKQIEKYANVNDPGSLARQTEKVRAHPELYTGAYNEATLAAFSKIDEWLRGSQGNFESVFQRMKDRQNGPHLPGEPLGILALIVANEVPYKDKQEIGNELLHATLNGKEQSEVRIGLAANDPLRDVVIDHGFEATGKQGRVLGVKQELYIKPAEPNTPKAHSE